MFQTKPIRWLCGAVVTAVALVGCGGSTEEGDGTAGTGGAGGSGGTAGSAGQAGTGSSGGAAGQAGTGGSGGAAGTAGQSGDCDSSSKPCPHNGSTCTEIVPGGFTVCALEVEEATSCTGSEMDECCDSSECNEGACYPNPVTPSCGGPQPADMNVCASDRCDDDSDCTAEQFCAPRGVNNNAVRYCMSKACTTDTDCTAQAGGICAPVRNPCCASWTGLFCVYPDGCRTDADCESDQYCDVNWDDGTGECEDGMPMCPA